MNSGKRTVSGNGLLPHGSTDTVGLIKTSVIIPVYNAAEYLPACLDSVFAQTQNDFEVICIDDDSDDGSFDILEAYAAEHGNMTVMRQDHALQGAARNRGLEVARGEFVYFLDADDVIEPGLLETCYAACQEHDLDFVTFDSRAFIERDGEMLPVEHPAIRNRLESGLDGQTVTGTAFWRKAFPRGYLTSLCWLSYQRRSLLLEHELIFEEGIYYEDNDWIARLHISARTMRYLPAVLHHYRVHPASTMGQPCTPLKVRSRARVHEALCGLYRTCTSDDMRYPVKCELCIGADRIYTFGQSDLSPECISELRLFADTLRDRIAQCAEDAASHDLCDIDRAMFRCIIWALRMQEGGLAEAPLPLDKEHLFEFEKALVTPDATVALYGTGELARRALSTMRTTGQEIRADLVFLNSRQATGQVFEGYPVYNVSDASALELDYVLLCSENKAREMKQALASHRVHAATVSRVPWQIKIVEAGCRQRKHMESTVGF